MRILKNPPKEFTIDRSKWICAAHTKGERGSVELLNKQGYMCCLGFYGLACGSTQRLLLNRTTPAALPISLPGVIVKYRAREFGALVHTNTCKSIIDTNDDAKPRSKIEKRLKELFKKIGTKVKFTGRYY